MSNNGAHLTIRFLRLEKTLSIPQFLYYCEPVVENMVFYTVAVICSQLINMAAMCKGTFFQHKLQHSSLIG